MVGIGVVRLQASSLARSALVRRRWANRAAFGRLALWTNSGTPPPLPATCALVLPRMERGRRRSDQPTSGFVASTYDGGAREDGQHGVRAPHMQHSDQQRRPHGGGGRGRRLVRHVAQQVDDEHQHQPGGHVHREHRSQARGAQRLDDPGRQRPRREGDHGRYGDGNGEAVVEARRMIEQCARRTQAREAAGPSDQTVLKKPRRSPRARVRRRPEDIRH